MMMHPSFRRLVQFASGELSAFHRPRLAQHLERCAACRASVAEIRALPAAVAELTSPVPPTGAWDAIAARVAAGEPVILPAAESAPRARRLPNALRAAAVVAVLLAAGAVSGVFTREAAAEISELRLAPERPGPGAVVRVEYRPGSLLDGADRLVLRARMLGHAEQSAWDVAPPFAVRMPWATAMPWKSSGDVSSRTRMTFSPRPAHSTASR